VKISESGATSCYERNDQQDDKDNTENLGNFCCQAGKSPKAENSGNQSNDKKGNSIVKHKNQSWMERLRLTVKS